VQYACCISCQHTRPQAVPLEQQHSCWCVFTALQNTCPAAVLTAWACRGDSVCVAWRQLLAALQLSTHLNAWERFGWSNAANAPLLECMVCMLHLVGMFCSVLVACKPIDLGSCACWRHLRVSTWGPCDACLNSSMLATCSSSLGPVKE
jgi:hypothetical protein